MRTSNTARAAIFCIAVILVATVTHGATEARVEGVFGASPVDANTAVAFWVPLNAGESVSGVTWFNNDGSTVFPEVLAIAGDGSDPAALAEALTVASDVSGMTSSWSSLDFDKPLVSAASGLYLVFRLPEGSDFQAEGLGGGAGFGYMAGDGTLRCWITGDGDFWSPVSPEYQFAVQPVLSANKSRDVIVVGEESPREDPAPKPDLPRQKPLSLNVSPNPFNPCVTISFETLEPAFVALEVYDLRGRSVRTIVREQLAQGIHEYRWDGRDNLGRKVSSGVYFARIAYGEKIGTARLTLVK